MFREMTGVSPKSFAIGCLVTFAFVRFLMEAAVQLVKIFS